MVLINVRIKHSYMKKFSFVVKRYSKRNNFKKLNLAASWD